MTRIVAGFAGSLALQVPKSGTRPTSDRVREAIFSALDARDELHGARVLDIYAGSGALGLEAASRGAATVMLVERDAEAVAVVRRNISALLKAAPKDKKPKIEVRSTNAQTFLAGSGSTYDLVFMDPPYNLGEEDLRDALLTLEHRLAPHATICLERSTRSPEPILPPGLTLDRRKDYGDTALYWISPA